VGADAEPLTLDGVVLEVPDLVSTNTSARGISGSTMRLRNQMTELCTLSPESAVRHRTDCTLPVDPAACSNRLRNRTFYTPIGPHDQPLHRTFPTKSPNSAHSPNLKDRMILVSWGIYPPISVHYTNYQRK